MKANKIYKIKIYSLLLFVFSLPFEYWDPFGIASFFTVTKFSGLLYFGLSLSDIADNFKLQTVKQPVMVLFCLWLFLLFQGIINYWHGTSLSVYSFTFLQNIVLFWLISNDLIRNDRLAGKLFISLITGVFLMASLSSFGIGLSNEINGEIGTYRLSFFGSNPNSVGNLAALAMLFAISIIMDKTKPFGNKGFLLIITLPSFISILSLSGSRGALVISFVGVFVLFLFQKIALNRKIMMLLLGSAFVVFTAMKMMQSDIMQRRIYLTTSEGSLGGREIIWKHALDIFYENPFLGLGNTGYQYEIIQRYGMYMDTHNLFLYFMATGGVIALFLYLIFLFNLFRASRNYYNHRDNVILFALLIVYLFSVFKSGGAINSKLYWIIAAIICGMGNSIPYQLSKMNTTK